MLQILNDDFETLCEITSYKSILWHELYLDESGGDFQLELPAEKYLRYIKKGYYVINDQSDKFGIIDTYQIDDTQEKAVLTVSGEMGESILKRRIVFPTMTLSGTLDGVVQTILNKHVIAPGNSSRKIDNFVYISNPVYSERVSKQMTGKRVSQVLVSLCGLLGYSYLVRLNAAKNGFELTLIAGKDRSVQQTANPHVNFTVDDYGVSDFRYLTSNKASYTHVVAAGEGEGYSRKYVVYPSYSYSDEKGLNRKEVFLDCSGISSDAGTDAALSDDDYYDKLEAEARSELQRSSTEEACEGTILPNRYRYRVDFGLGDIVSVTDEELDMAYDTRTLGALLSWDENGATAVTMEMGDLEVEDIADDPEEPEEDDVVEEPEEDTGITNILMLNDSLFPFSVSGGNLSYCDKSGNKQSTKRQLAGSIFAYDNQNLLFNLSCSAYVVKDSSGQTDTLGEITIELPKMVYSMMANILEEDFAELVIPVTSAGSDFTMKYKGTVEPETDENGVLLSDTYKLIFDTAIPISGTAPVYLYFSLSQLLRVEADVTFVAAFGVDYVHRHLKDNVLIDQNTGYQRYFGNCGIYSTNIIDYSRWQGDSLEYLRIPGHGDLDYGVDYTMENGTLELLVTEEELRTKYDLSDNMTSILLEAKVNRQLTFFGSTQAIAGEYTSWDLCGYSGITSSNQFASSMADFNASIGNLGISVNMLYICVMDSDGNAVQLTRGTDYTLTTPSRGMGDFNLKLLADHPGKLCVYISRGKNAMI